MFTDEELRRFFALSPDLFFIMGDDHKLQRANPALLNLLGYSYEELSARPIIEFVHPDDQAAVRQLPGGDLTVSLETRFFCRDGTVRWLEWTATPVPSEERIYGVGRDVTERKQTEAAALAESEIRYRTVADFTYDWEYWQKPNGILEYVSPSCQRITGYAAEEFIANPGLLDEIVLPEDRALWLGYRHDERRTLETGIVQFRIRRKDGDICWIEHASQPIIGRKGGFLGFRVSNRDITDRKVVEKALRESEHQYRLLVETMNEGIVVRNLEGIITYANQKFCHMVGHSPEEVIGGQVEGFLTEGGIPVFLTELEKRRRGEGGVYELDFLHRDGHIVSTLVAGTPILDQQGEYRGSFATITDITDKKRIENQLRESESRYRQMFEHNIAVKLLLDPDTGRIVDANSAAAAFYHYDCDTLKTMRIMDLNTAPEEDVFQNLRRTRSEEQVYFRLKHRLANGEIRDVDVYSGPVEDQGKKLLYSIIIDVTDRLRAEAELRESQERWTAFMMNSPTPTFLKDEQGKIVYVNPAFENTFGVTEADWAGKNDYDLWPPEMAAQFRKNDRAVLESGRPLVIEETVPLKGEEHFWLTYKFPFRDSQGHHFLAGMTFDITERKQALNRALALAIERERVQILSHFIENTSHEFKTPLSILQTSLYLLEKQADPDKQKQYVEKIREQIGSLVRLVEELVRMTELDDLTQVKRQKVDLNLLVEEAAARVQSRAEAKRLVLTRQLESSLPLISADADWAGEMLVEILDNAIRYTPEGGAVTVRTRLYEEYLVVEIQDSGVGIPPDVLPHIFERFYRADEAHSTRGFGLGLAIAKKVAELHEGEIRVKSEVGKGSTFTILLPVE